MQLNRLPRLKHDGMSFLKLNHWLMPCDGSLRTKQFRTVEHMPFASLIPYQQTEGVTGWPFNLRGGKSKFFGSNDDGRRFKPSARRLESE